MLFLCTLLAAAYVSDWNAHAVRCASAASIHMQDRSCRCLEMADSC